MRSLCRCEEATAARVPEGAHKSGLLGGWEHAMPIVSKLKVVMADRDVSVNELSEKVGRSAVNLSHLRCNRSKSIRFSLLEELCRELRCQPGDLLVYEPAPREEQD
jgi:putative transcriptional regulator